MQIERATRVSYFLAGALLFCLAGVVARAQDSATESSGSAAQAAAAAAASPARVPGSVQNAKLIHSVAPVYPAAAEAAHIEGTVVLHGTITKEGTVSEIEVVSGPAELTDASIAAVKQWVYEPAKLNGKPVDVDTTINLKFTDTSRSADGGVMSAAEAGAAAAAADSAAAKARADSKGSDPSGTAAVAGAPAGPPPPAAGRIRIGGNVMAAQIVRQVQPVYPSSAKANHVQGTVVLHAIIRKDGAIRDLTYVSGPKELVDACLDAVKKWKYRPTMLQGNPVEVDTTISVVFTLGNAPQR